MGDDESPITIVLGRFGALIDRGLREILGSDLGLRILATGLDQAELEVAVARHAPRIAILDEAYASRPVMLRRLRRLQAAQPSVKLVVLTHRAVAHGTSNLPFASAVGLSKDASGADIRAAIQRAISGQSIPDKARQLTRRETEVLRHISGGYRYREIANSLSIHPETVKTHSANIRRKLGVESRWELLGLPLPDRPAD